MPNGYMIIGGWRSKAYLYFFGSLVTALPVQSDMIAGRRWVRPGNDADILKPAKLVDSPSGYRFAYGGMIFTWSMVGLSPKMVKFLQDTYFGGTFSGKITVQTFNRQTGEWEVYNTIARLPDVTADAEPAMGGYNNFKISFANADPAPTGFNLTPEITNEDDIVLGIDYVETILVTNIGDDATLGTTILTVDIPEKTYLRELTSYTDWTPSYSINDGASYSGSPPMDLGTVTNLRFTRSDVLDAGDAYESVEITLKPDEHGDTSATTSVTSQGELNTSDNTDTVDFSIEGRSHSASFSRSYG